MPNGTYERIKKSYDTLPLMASTVEAQHLNYSLLNKIGIVLALFEVLAQKRGDWHSPILSHWHHWWWADNRPLSHKYQNFGVTNTDPQLHKYQLGGEILNCPPFPGGQVENGRFIDLLICAIARTEYRSTTSRYFIYYVVNMAHIISWGRFVWFILHFQVNTDQAGPSQ